MWVGVIGAAADDADSNLKAFAPGFRVLKRNVSSVLLPAVYVQL